MNALMGKIQGRGVIVGPDGKPKGEVVIEIDGTREQFDEMKKSLNLKETEDGSDSHDRGA